MYVQSSMLYTVSSLQSDFLILTRSTYHARHWYILLLRVATVLAMHVQKGQKRHGREIAVVMMVTLSLPCKLSSRVPA